MRSSVFELQRPPLVHRKRWDAAVAVVLKITMPAHRLLSDSDDLLLYAVETCGAHTVAELLRRGARFSPHYAQRALGEADAATIRCIAQGHVSPRIRCTQGYFYCCKDAPPAEVFERLTTLVQCFGPPKAQMAARCIAVLRSRISYCVERVPLGRALGLLLAEPSAEEVYNVRPGALATAPRRSAVV